MASKLVAISVQVHEAKSWASTSCHVSFADSLRVLVGCLAVVRSLFSSGMLLSGSEPEE